MIFTNNHGSVIGIKEHNMITCITSMTDGSIEVTGSILNEHYSYTDLQIMISMGNLKKLSTKIDDCVFCRNDNDLGNDHNMIFNNLDSFTRHFETKKFEHMYLYHNSLWWAYTRTLPFKEMWVPVTMALELLNDDDDA